MSAWQPHPQGLEELVGVLRNSTSPDQAVQAQMTERLNSFQAIPDYVAYLAHILVILTSEEETTRAVSGLILKNTIARAPYASPSPLAGSSTSLPNSDPSGLGNLDPIAVGYVKFVILKGMSDKSQTVRKTVGTVIVNIMALEREGGWPQGLEGLMKGVDSADPNEQEGAFNSLSKLAEDCPEKLDCEIGGVRPLNYLIERLLAHSGHPLSFIRVYALTCIKHYVPTKSQAIMSNIDGIMQALFHRASDESSDVRALVCQTLTMLLTARPDKVLPEMNNIAEYMIHSTRDQDEQVALEASEFWLNFGEDPSLAEALKPWLPKVAPILLAGMVYSQSDLDWMGAEDEEDEAVPDKESDIKPRHFGAKAHEQSHFSDPSSSTSNGFTNGSNGASANGTDPSDDEEDEDDYSEDEDDDEDFQGEWNLRKCSAAALDVMAVTFGQDMLEILLPDLQSKLFSEDWLQKESAILALGAIAEGCISAVQPHLPQLMPYLVQALGSDKALVRSITCWTIGRYSNWVVLQEGEGHALYFVPVMEGLLRMSLDPNKRVQEAGCSAFATLEEEAGTALNPYLGPILQSLVQAFTKYQQKNLLILYDAIGTLADSVGDAISRPEYLDILMPPLIRKWQSLADDDLGLVPLLECMSSVTIGAKAAFAPYARPVFERCLNIIQSSLLTFNAYHANPDEYEEPEPSFVVVALDLLSGLCQGLGQDIVTHVQASSKNLVELMSACVRHPEPGIRQSALALLGDIAIAAFPLIQPQLSMIMPNILEQIDVVPEDGVVSVCNNAVWAAGEIALQHTADATPLEPFVGPLIERLVPIICNPKSVRSLSENAAVTIGRCGLVCPGPIAPHLEIFARPWCEALWEIKDNEEKDSAFRGFCMLIQANPAGIQKEYMWWCNAVCKWQDPSAELNDMFTKILQGMKQMMGEQGWEAAKQTYPQPLRARLAERYQDLALGFNIMTSRTYSVPPIGP